MPHQQEAQKNFAARWFEEVWNKSRREAIDEMFPKDAVLHDGRAEYRGPTKFKRFYDALRAQLSEVRVTPLETISEGDVVCVRWSSTQNSPAQVSISKSPASASSASKTAASSKPGRIGISTPSCSNSKAPPPNPSPKPPDNLQSQPPNAS